MKLNNLTRKTKSSNTVKRIPSTKNKKIKPSILLIDDDESICELIKISVESQTDYKLIYRHSGENIIDVIHTENPDLIILDIMLPEQSGYDICREIKLNNDLKNIPIIMLTAAGNPAKAAESGADDFIAKPFSNEILLEKIDKFINKKIECNPDLGSNNVSDLSARHNHLSQQTSLDAITNLPTLSFVINQLKTTMKELNNFGIIYIDIARFSKIEETYGWKILDRILFNTAEVLESMKGKIFRKEDLVMINMSWSDDFIIFLSPPRFNNLLDYNNLFKVKDRVEEYLRNNIEKLIAGTPLVNLGFFIGCALSEKNELVRFERLVHRTLKDAVQMAYNLETKKSDELKKILRQVIKNEDIKIVYQPVIDVNSLEPVGYEALARGPENTLLSDPEIMFTLAKEEKVICDLDELCRKKSFIQINNNKLLFINVEPESFSNVEFIKKVKNKKLPIPNENIVFEITERTSLEDLSKFLDVIQEFKEAGVKIAIDDAGSGFSSLLFIAKVKPDILKLDISLIKDIESDCSKSNIVSILINYAHQQEIKVVAEGVEIFEEYIALKKLNVDYIQGFYFAMPSSETNYLNFKEKIIKSEESLKIKN